MRDVVPVLSSLAIHRPASDEQVDSDTAVVIFVSLRGEGERSRICVVKAEICDKRFREKSDLFVLVEHSDALFVLVIVGQHPKALGPLRVSLPLVEVLTESHYTAECKVPAIGPGSMISFRNGSLATAAFDQLVNLPAVKVGSMDKRVGSLASTQH